MTDTELMVKLFENYNRMFIKLADMIGWVAARTLTDKEFKEFWDKFADKAGSGMKEYIVQATAQETIDSFDAHNAPELIRCMDCKNMEWVDVDDETVFCRLQRMAHSWDFYCADGERKKYR